MPTNERTIRFPGGAGHELAAVLHRPPGPLRACALFAHCFTCGKDLRALRELSSALAERGIATLRFDFTGLGESGGDFAATTFGSNLDDLVAAADWLRAEHLPPTILIGHSLGGAAALGAAHRIPEVKAIATIGAPAHPAHVGELFTDQRAEIEAAGEAEVVLADRPFRIQKRFLDELEEHCSAEKIGALKRALLILHAPLDASVGIDNARQIFEAARHPKSFVSLDGADHLLGRPEDARYVAEVLGAWASRYVPAPASDVAEGHVIVEGRDGLRQHVQAGHHALRADEPKRLGGTDEGPTPYDLLLAALGACTSMTMRMYADRKGWPLEAVSVELTHAREHATDSGASETAPRRIDVMERAITVEGPLDAEQRARLHEIADKCPVHRTLHGEIVVRTTIEAG